MTLMGKLAGDVLNSIDSITCTLSLKKSRRVSYPFHFSITLKKIVSNIFINKLDLIMQNMTGEKWIGFISDCNTLDEVLITEEVIHLCKKKRRGLLVKLNFRKAYNMVNLGVLIQILANSGSNNKWIIWIKWLFSTKMQILVIDNQGK